MPPQVSTDGAMSTVSFELSGAEPRICGSAVCLRSAFDDRLLLFQKVKIFKALLLFSVGRPGSSCQSALGFVFFFFFFYTRGEAGRAHSRWNGFTGARRSADTLVLLLGPIVLPSV